MKAAVLRTPGGLDRIEVHDIPDPGQPGPGQIRIALHASSLNYHDLLVANGGIPTADGRVLMSGGAGVVEAVGEGVAEFRPGDHVVSCFFPQFHFSKRGVCRKPLDQVGICDVGTTKCHQICQAFCDKAIAPITVHLHIRDQCAFVERTEMPEHAIVGDFLKWRTCEVGGVPHEQQVRQIVGAQLLYCVFGDGQSFVVGLEGAAFVHGTDLDSNPLCIDLIQDRLDDFEKKS